MNKKASKQLAQAIDEGREIWGWSESPLNLGEIRERPVGRWRKIVKMRRTISDYEAQSRILEEYGIPTSHGGGWPLGIWIVFFEEDKYLTGGPFVAEEMPLRDTKPRNILRRE